MRVLTKPSTARRRLEHYTAFLLAEAQSAGCVRLSEVSGGGFAHDAANRFLNREAFSPRNLFEEMRPLIVLEEGILSVDDKRGATARTGSRKHRRYKRSTLFALGTGCTLSVSVSLPPLPRLEDPGTGT